MSTNASDLGRAPVSQSPLWRNGRSLMMGTVTALGGLASALADEQRSADQAEILHNLQQVSKRGVWSSHGIGYVNDNASPINSGATILEFGKFYDSSGNLNLLLQCGGNVYPYNTSTHAVGLAISGLTGLSTSAIPCMRPYSPSTQTTQPITVYCNGQQNPVKITSTTTSAGLGFNNGTQQQTATLSGTMTAGNLVTLSLSYAGMAVNPHKISYTLQTGDAAADVAGGLAKAINGDAIFQQAGITAAAGAQVVTMSVPNTSASYGGWTSTVTGGTVCYVQNVNNPGAWPVILNGKTYQNPQFCEPIADRMVYAGFPDASTQYDVLISNQGSAETFYQSSTLLATDAYVFTVRAQLGPITGIKSFRPNNMSNTKVLIVGQRDGVSILTGTDTTSFSFDILTSQYGIINNRCWAQVLDDLVFLTDKGVFSFSSLVNNLTKPEDALSFPVADKIAQMDFANYPQKHFVVHYPLTQEIQFWGPWITDAGVPQHGLILSYRGGGLGSTVWSTKGGFTMTAGIDYRNTMYGGDSAGYVQNHYNGDTYNGNTILFDYVSSLITVGDITQAGRMQNLAIITEGGSQQFAVNAYYYAKYIDGTCRKLVATPAAHIIKQGNEGLTVLPFTLGESSFPGDFVKIYNYRPIGRGYAWKIELTNSNIAGDGLDYSSVKFTISIGGFVRP